MKTKFLLWSFVMSNVFAFAAQAWVIQPGDQVIAIDSVRNMTVIARQPDGNFVVQADNGDRYTNISSSDLAIRTGSMNGISVGERMMAVDSVRDMTIVGLQPDGNFVVQADNGDRYANIGASDLAREYGSSGEVSVAEWIIAIDSARPLQVVAIEQDGSFILQDTSGSRYANITRSDLAVTYGSYGGHWVGETVIAIDSGRTLQIAAIQADGRYVLTDGSSYYANIGSDDLATTQRE